MIDEAEFALLIKTVERSLHSRIDTNKGEQKLAVGVIVQAISDLCLDDNYSGVPIYRPKEQDVTGKMFFEGEGILCWSAAAGLDSDEVYRIAMKAKDYVRNA